jgi:hypothetical protein
LKKKFAKKLDRKTSRRIFVRSKGDNANYSLTNINTMKRPINLMAEYFDEILLKEMKEWLELNKEKLTTENKEYKMKVGDIITFRNAYGIPMKTKIIAFDKETGNPYLYWDCYWFELDLKTRLL